MPESFIDYFALYGPFAVLFVILFYWTLKTNNEREEKYREEIKELHGLLRQFADKYDLVIDKITALDAKIEQRR